MNTQNFFDAATLVQLAATASRTSSNNGSGVDLREFAGDVGVVLDSAAASAGTNPTLDVTLEDSADNSSFAAVSPAAAFTQVTSVAGSQKLVVNKDGCRRYVRAKWVIGGTSSPAFTFSVNLLGYPKYPA